LAENLSKMYEKGNETVKKQLPHAYSVMARELRHLANIVGNIGWIKWVNKPILNAKAIMSDDTEAKLNCYRICGPAWLVVCIPAGFAGGVPGAICAIVAAVFCYLVCESQ
jgi:hypothetical protein